MADETISSRRSFLKGGALIAAPLTVAVPGAAIAADEREERLKHLEDEAAIRALHRDWLRRVNGRNATADLFVNAGAAQCLDEAVCGVVMDETAADTIKIAADGKRATGQFLCTIETESRMAPQNTFAQMALAQGGGVTRTSERRLVTADYLKAGDRWLIAKVETAAA